MKISRGPMLEKYAFIIGEDIESVIEHVNGFVNHGSDIPGAAKTEKERFDHIKLSIQNRIDNSDHERVLKTIRNKHETHI